VSAAEPEMLPYFPRAVATTRGDRAALIQAATGAGITYSGLDEFASRLAKGFRSLGLRPGDHLSMCLENRPDYPALWWGAYYAGLYYTPISTRLTPREVGHILKDSGSTVLIASPSQADRLLPELHTLVPNVRAFVAGGRHEHGEPLERLISGRGIELPTDGVEGAPMLYSSGTTGQPKGIKRPLSGAPLGSTAAVAALAQGVFGLGPDSIYLTAAPLYHAAGVGFVNAATALGATTVILDRFDAEQVLAAIERYGVTHAQFVPTMFIRMLALPADVRAAYDLSSLRCAIHAAAPCPISVKNQMLDWWGPVVHEYYSGTEGVGFCHCGPADWKDHEGSVGRPLMGELHIVDDAGHEAPQGVDGRIYFGNSPSFEYHNDPDKTRDAHLNGWATLGDIGHVDADGFLYLTDRASDMIITGGVNVYPLEAENVLISHPAVEDVAVIGVPNEEFGEEVKAIVQVAFPAEAGPALAVELIAWCRGRLADVKCPRTVEFRVALPREETGKLYKRLLRDEDWAAATSRGAS